MKRMVVLVVLALAAVSSFAAEPMTDAERAKLVAHLERTAARFEKSLASVSEAQWTFKPAPERWSVGEAAEHIITSEGFLRGMAEPAMKVEASEEALKSARKEEMFDKMLVDRSRKFQAPEPLQPTGKFASPKEALEAFRAERQKTIDFVKNGGDFRMHVVEHPAAGVMDGYSWVVFLSAHSERHTLQIEEVQADAGYPK